MINSIAIAATPDFLGACEIVNRSDLTYLALNSAQSSLVDFRAYAFPANAANSDQTFHGTLTLIGTNSSGSFTEIGTTMSAAYRDPGHLPEFSYQFIQTGSHIFPVKRGLISTSHPDWYYILAPGRVWNERSDNGFERAAIPFSLQEKGANCTHNGVLTFLFKADGSVSRVAYQIASETCQYFQFNMWGSLVATYTPQSIPGSASMISSYAQEVAARIPVKPIVQLAADYPSAGIDVENIGSDQSAEFMTVFGVAIDGIHYVGGCNTRYGEYPYCDELALPSYSIAKSVVGAIGLMRLEKKYPGMRAMRAIKEIEKCSGPQWRDVTLLNALDMATGNYASAQANTDEDAPATMTEFFLVNTYLDKTKHACSYTRKAAPGIRWVYHTSDTFLLGAAMNAIYRQREGRSKDFYTDMLVKDLWKPLKMSPTTYTTMRTNDSAAASFTGYGLTFHRDDIVKVSTFLNEGTGQINGRTLLDRSLLREALQKTRIHGLNAGAGIKYLHGFWAWNAGSSSTGAPLCGNERWIPFMSGFAGIGVVMLPSQMVYYFVSDHQEYGFKKTLIELNKIRSFC